ncbi:MAG: Lrp/AsnC ligand binding domain-containing protein [Bacteroidetes bacterium]|jgi:Lrp/AsnC family transcriptional regulator for asnA, asnC and gidA|nr:Lrp/AsnC ligand binding domain-containing protein [Bacteroidota bacterium]
MSEHKPSLDELDKNILQMLLHDASIPYTDIARELKVSGGTIHVRMKKMQEAGIVLGSRLVVDYARLGFDVLAFLGIYLEKGSVYAKALHQLRTIPEIVELHYTTGMYNMYAKIVCRDTRHLREVLNDKIQVIEGVERTETFISLECGIDRELTLET